MSSSIIRHLACVSFRPITQPLLHFLDDSFLWKLTVIRTILQFLNKKIKGNHSLSSYFFQDLNSSSIHTLPLGTAHCKIVIQHGVSMSSLDPMHLEACPYIVTWLVNSMLQVCCYLYVLLSHQTTDPWLGGAFSRGSILIC